ERRDERDTRKAEKKKSSGKAVKKFTDLKNLETFSDIAVIQRRYLPKTGRFEFYIAGGTNLNDSFFVGNGINARFGYYFSEKWGLEFNGSFIQNDNRDVTNELLNRRINTEGMVSTESYYGLDLKWTPIYGKYSYFNEKIIPFDLYFTLGLGMTTPNVGDAASGSTISVDNAPTLRLGSGQVFAITIWMAFRCDLSWHFFNSRTTITTGTTTQSDESLQNNLFLNLGLSFFFPEAKYR
ncbi:MAG: outer membrane beta-barrel domain-containing protein, partial [Bdellovibrionales bacterium]|nr:outer membrane beta-barrel domain-containing protein [Bdellovibrionales bacterium]NQZ19545.1 outer membrane beta-barrel domain-containing protein [Bdellovibrionales bacterium]